MAVVVVLEAPMERAAMVARTAVVAAVMVVAQPVPRMAAVSVVMGSPGPEDRVEHPALRMGRTAARARVAEAGILVRLEMAETVAMIGIMVVAVVAPKPATLVPAV